VGKRTIGTFGHWPYLFIAPFFILYSIFQLFPFFWSMFLSLHEWNGISAMNFVGLENYRRLVVEDPFFLRSIGNTLFLMTVYFPFLLIGGLLLAVALYSERLRFAKGFRLAIFLPYITTPVAIGIIFGLIFDRNIGVLNGILTSITGTDVSVNWLGDTLSARVIVSGMVTWRYIGYHAIVFLGALSTIPTELYDAAKVDGASAVQRFFAVTVPGIKRVGLFLLVTDIIGGFQLVEEPMLLFTGWATGTNQIGGPGRGVLTAIWYLFDQAFQRSSRLGYGAAIGYGLFVFIIVFSILGARLNRGGENE
jgi:cellobiose transport system permease protein